MKALYAIFFILLPSIAFSQQVPTPTQKWSEKKLVYKVSAKQAQQYLLWDSIPIKDFENAEIYKELMVKNDHPEDLPIGNYVIASAKLEILSLELFNKTNLSIQPINFDKHLNFHITDKRGSLIKNVTIYTNQKLEGQKDNNQFYTIKGKHLEDKLITVYTPTDTLFANIDITDYSPSIAKQKWRNFKRTKLISFIRFIPTRIKLLLKGESIRRNRNNYGKGFMVLNQPKYKPLDSILFKAYVIDKKQRPYTKKVQMLFTYQERNKEKIVKLPDLTPVSKGAYVGKFLLGDSIPVDFSGYLMLLNKKNKKLVSTNIRGEDYLLNSFRKVEMIPSALEYLRGQDISILVSVKDANNKFILDGKAECIITAEQIISVNNTLTTVKDTLYRFTQNLQTETSTTFKCSTDSFPNASLKLKATINFSNSNNEQESRVKEFNYYTTRKTLAVTQLYDSLEIEAFANGVFMRSKAYLVGDNGTRQLIDIPTKIKINPLVSEYTVTLSDSSLTEQLDVNTYNIRPAFGSSNDTLLIQFSNFVKVNINYRIVDGNKIIAQGSSNEEIVNIAVKADNPRKAYRLYWSYFWAGKEENGTDLTGIYYKTLSVTANAKEVVAPGETDSVKIKVTDFKGNPVSNVNLTGLSYNEQFRNQRIPSLPYTSKYKTKKYFREEEYEDAETASTMQNYFFYNNEKWIKKLGLDTVKYYTLLLPKSVNSVDKPTESLLPSFTINVVEKGRALQMYLIFINNSFVYTNLAKEPQALVFNGYPGYTKFEIRLYDKIITVDSFYLQTKYHHDIVFDVDALPKNSKIIIAENFWSNYERRLLENSLMQLENNSMHNNSYLWQGNRVIKLKAYSEHLAGPFNSSNINFYQPGNFDLHFPFEPGYIYRISKNVTRLEKHSIFPAALKKALLANGKYGTLNYEDTLIPVPIVSYETTKAPRRLYLFPDAYRYMNDIIHSGKARLETRSVNNDTVIIYTVLKSLDSLSTPMILANNQLANINPGNYEVTLITSNLSIVQFPSIELKADTKTVLLVPTKNYFYSSKFLDSLSVLYNKKIEEQKKNVQPTDQKEISYDPYTINSLGGASIIGRIIDSISKNPIVGASIIISQAGTISDMEGRFIMRNIKSGIHKISFSAVGYSSQSLKINITEGNVQSLEILMSYSNSALEEVVVTALGLQRRSAELGYSTAKISSITLAQGLTGKVAGLNVQNTPGGANSIKIRGISSLTSNNDILLVIDGIKMPNGELAKIDPNNIKEVTTLSAEAATAIYGPDGVYGAIVITTKTKTERKTFRDFAYWNPNFFTNNKGEAVMEASYPDNVTGWHSYILAIDKKNRTGQTEFLTQAYKPMLAELSVPQFLIQGDLSNVIGKSLNYTDDDYNTTGIFSINGVEQKGQEFNLAKKGSSIFTQTVNADGLDTLKINYRINTTTGYKDGEERKIPVLKKGIEENIGQFYVIKSDTSFSLPTSSSAEKMYIYAQNNNLDLLLEEIEHIKDYPFYCMEQTASKLTGYHLQKKIYAKTGKTFTSERDMNKLVSKLQKGQLYNGAWPWWENGNPNFAMTNYIINALLPHREAPLVEQNLKEASAYLQNNLANYNTQDLLTALVTLNKTNGYFEFGQWLKKINFDSLTTFEQWNFVAIKQTQQLNYTAELDKLMKKQIPGMLGSVHWGDDKYNWQNNDIACTLLALEVLRKTNLAATYTDKIVQFFLERRKQGYWRNTVESAKIADAIFDLYAANSFNKSDRMAISFVGDTSFTTKEFPLKFETSAKNITIQKSGNGIVYFTAYEKIFNANPKAVVENFVVTTSFSKNNQVQTALKAGEQYNMVVIIDAKSEADYVQIDIPIPAACNYANKNTLNQYFPQYAKDKLTLFTEKLTKGRHEFLIPLEARYSGTYHLNPAKIELMYFPSFYGREGMKRVVVE